LLRNRVPWQWAQNLGPVYRAQILRLPPSL
jgi:hypothetical protein